MLDVDILFAGLAVADFDAAVDWYTRLLGRPPDVVVKQDEVMWRIASRAWLYVVEDAQRAGHGLVTLSVADLDETVEELGGKGISCGRITIVGDDGRKVSCTDLDGNTVSFIEVAASAG